MRLVVPNREHLEPVVRTALDAMASAITEASSVNETADGRNLKTIFAAYHNTTQSINDSVWTQVNFNAQTDLRGVNGVKVPVGVHDNTVSPNKFIVPRGLAGLVRVRVRVWFNAHATGFRGVRLTKNEILTSYGSLLPASAAISFTIINEFSVVASGGDALGIEAFQNSGGALAIGLTAASGREGQNEIELEFP